MSSRKENTQDLMPNKLDNSGKFDLRNIALSWVLEYKVTTKEANSVTTDLEESMLLLARSFAAKSKIVPKGMVLGTL